MGKKKFSYKASKTIKIIACLLITVLLMFVVQPMLYKSQSKIAEIVVATTYIPKGTEITSTNVQVKEVGSYGLPTQVITDKTLVIGQRAQVDIVSGDYITAGKIGDKRDALDAGEILKAGKSLVTVTLDTAAAGVSTNLVRSDFVNVAIAKEDDMGQITIIEPADLKNIQVFSIENTRGQNVESLRAASAESDDIIASTATLIVNGYQANELIKAEYTGKIHLIFVKRGGMDE